MLVDQVNDAMRTAAEEAKNAQKAGNKLKAPVQYTGDAAKRLTKALAAFEKVKTDEQFDAVAFRARSRKQHALSTRSRAAQGE